ncbi:Uncharacterised protein [Vibrio cholerae]|uniref:Uncharacterized protein n=1 Tax=Vibrio cholerae TaxID=666 RepID=A0A655ZE54_VIBCL|nr:Uncharacterised protein [Vibrio cholerae]
MTSTGMHLPYQKCQRILVSTGKVLQLFMVHKFTTIISYMVFCGIFGSFFKPLDLFFNFVDNQSS